MRNIQHLLGRQFIASVTQMTPVVNVRADLHMPTLDSWHTKLYIILQCSMLVYHY